MGTLGYILIIGGILFVLWTLAHLKTRRPDGTLEKVHPYRRIMFYIMPTRNESVVYFDSYIRADNLLRYLEKAKGTLDADMTHCVVAACNVGLASTPQMNRFVVGKRLYARKGRFVTFSMKRKALDKKAKLATVKLAIEDGESFAELCGRMNEQVTVERSGKRTHADKEFDLFNLLPRPLFAGAARLLRGLDYFNLLPGFFLRDDPMYTSLFVANLGSLKMRPAFHHLYEYGTCPLFAMVGAVEERPVVEDGQVIVAPVLHVRYSYDERIDDGLTSRSGIEAVKRVLEDPERWLGCVEEGNAPPMWPREDWEEV